MKIINHEYYVSPEIAKLLKEAGFDWRVRYMYRNNNPTLCICTERSYRNISKPNKCPMYWQYAAPTLEVAQRWLREVKDIHIDIIYNPNMIISYTYDILFPVYNARVGSLISYTTYEEAQVAGIKKVLEIILEKGE